MKRFFFTVIALAAVAVSCTKSGLLESPQTYETPITFEPYTGKAPTTKAAAVETKDIATAGFRVLGFTEGTSNSITDAEKANPTLKRVVTSADEGANWSYPVPMYWQDNQSMSFAAYGLNVNANRTVNTTTGDIDDTQDTGDTNPFKKAANYTEFTYKVPGAVSAQKDLVISPFITGKNSSNSTSGITVNLYHVLSRVGFKLKVEGTDGINIIIKDIRLTGKGYDEATFDLTDAVVEPATGSTVTYNKSFPKDATDNNKLADKVDISYSLLGSTYVHGGTNSASTYPGFIVKSNTIKKNADGEPVDNDDNVLGEDETPITIEQVVPICKTTTTFYPSTDEVPYDPKNATVFSNPTAEELANRFMMFLPQTFTDANIEVIYQIAGAEEQLATLPITTAFSAGKAYEFIFTVSTTAVGFGVTVDPWETDLNGNGKTDDDIPYPLN